ncbi:MAG: hypothetical protein JWO38_3447 [Gemmataceae bacterium]|nr:hypothetical protein [Gemmataceae bacterium]
MNYSRWWIGLPAVAAAAGLVVGCLSSNSRQLPHPIATVFDQPDDVVLYSLEPAPPGAAATDPARETFHGHTVLGKTAVTNQLTRRKLFAAFRQGVDDHDGSVAACFIPHHGLRVRSGQHVVDLVICFKCAQVQVYADGAATESVLISTSPRPTFNEVLRAARVPLSPDAE